MFIKSLKISTPSEVIRNINFHSGLNLIVDKTPTTDIQTTGNNVGKTTVLKLIDFCLGAEPKEIYSHPEDRKKPYQTIKNFLEDNNVLIELVLVDDFTTMPSRQLKIERNFLSHKQAIRKINGKQILDKDFNTELLKHFFPNQEDDKPSFREMISRNIRHTDKRTSHTLKTLSPYAKPLDYQTLNLFLFGVPFYDSSKKAALSLELTREKDYKKRLESNETLNGYEQMLKVVYHEVVELNRKKDSFNLNEDFEDDLEVLNRVRNQINRATSNLSVMSTRKNIIEEAQAGIKANIFEADMPQLRTMYGQVASNIDGLQKTFEDLVDYHNKMTVEKINFITAELPALIQNISSEKTHLQKLLGQEKECIQKISKGDSFQELETIIGSLNDKHQLVGEYEAKISQIKNSEIRLEELQTKMDSIDAELFSEEFEQRLKDQVTKFNVYFSAISQELYGETYMLKFEKITTQKKEKLYEFSAFNDNMSAGKKQGEILCFDLAYVLFAQAEKLPHLRFLLNDKKELMHDNQLNKVSDFAERKNIQIIASILADKLPEELLRTAYVAIELSQDDKLFKI